MPSFEPNLAAKLKVGQTYDQVLTKYADKIDEGVFCTPKIDGIRCSYHPALGPVSRTLEQVPNSELRSVLYALPELRGLDFEITYGDVEDVNYSFQKTFSMYSGDQEKHRIMVANAHIYVFDDFSDMSVPYDQRIRSYTARLTTQFTQFVLNNTGIKIIPVEAFYAGDASEIYAHEETFLERHYEGLMFRHRHSLYKMGRSTWKEMGLCAIKRFVDAEARVIGVEEMMHNDNEATIDARGYTHRSSENSGKIPAGMLGKLVAQVVNGDFVGEEIRVGSGFSRAQRMALWSNPPIGKTFTFKYQPVGIKEKPRAPIFKSFRQDI